MKNPVNEQRRQRNPIRAMMHLPQDVANLDEIDWSPLPEPAEGGATERLFASTKAEKAA
jgi:hypothetical protein